MLVKIDKNTDLGDCNVLNLNLNIILKYLLYKGLALGAEVSAAAGDDDALDCCNYSILNVYGLCNNGLWPRPEFEAVRAAATKYAPYL